MQARVAGDLEGVADIGELERHGDVFERRHVGDQMEGLEDDADVAAAEFRDMVFAERVQRRAVDVDFAAVERSRPARTISSVDLPEPEGPTMPTDSPASIVRSMPFQHMDGRCGSGRASDPHFSVR